MQTVTLRKAVGARIEKARNARGLTQAETARLLGMSVSGFRKWEYGISVVSVEDLSRLSEILGQPMAYFVAEDATPEDSHGIHLARKIGYLDSEGRRMIETLIERFIGNAGKADGPELEPVIRSRTARDLMRSLALA